MTDWNNSDPIYDPLLSWIADQSRTTAGKPQYGTAQQKNLTSFLSLANNPLLGVLSGGYDPMTYVPQYQDQPQPQTPFAATDYAVNAYKQRYGSNQTVQDLFNQADQGTDQASLNALIDNADPQDVASWGITPQQAKDAVNGYFNVKADQAQAQAKYQYGLANDATSGAGGGGGGATGANGYGADGLPSKSNYFGIDPTLGNQLQEYVPPEVQAQRDNVLQRYMQESQGVGNAIDTANQNFDSVLADRQQQAANEDQAHNNALLALVGGGQTPGSQFQGIPGVHQLQPLSPDYQKASQIVDDQGIRPEDLVGYFAKANARNSGQKAHQSGGESSVSAFLAQVTGDQARPKLWDSQPGDMYDLKTIRGIANGPASKQQTVRTVYDQLTGNSDRMRRNNTRLNAMQDYASRRQSGQDWAQQNAQRKAAAVNSIADDLRRLGGYQPQTVLQHNLQQRIGSLMSLGLYG